MSEEFKTIETQEQFDAALKPRLARERDKVRAEFADYDDLKAKAAKWDEAEAKGKSELQKAQERIAELEASAKERDEADRLRALREKVSKETGVPASLIAGADEDSMAASAAAIAEFAKKPAAPKVAETGRFGSGARASGKEEMGEFVSALLNKNE